MAFDFLNVLYDVRDEEQRAFGEHWVDGAKLMHGEWTLCAIYNCKPDSDGHHVDVYCMAMPARFYKLDVYAWPNSVGEVKPGWEIITGSSAHAVAALMAHEISRGMVGFRPHAKLGGEPG